MFAATLLPPAPRQPRGSRALTLVGILCAVWLGHVTANPARADDLRPEAYTFGLAACTPARAYCSEIFTIPDLPDLEACKALAPAFDGPIAHRRVLPGVSPKELVLAWTCTPRLALPEA